MPLVNPLVNLAWCDYLKRSISPSSAGAVELIPEPGHYARCRNAYIRCSFGIIEKPDQHIILNIRIRLVDIRMINELPSDPTIGSKSSQNGGAMDEIVDLAQVCFMNTKCALAGERWLPHAIKVSDQSSLF
jgi:hypothetical protein